MFLGDLWDSELVVVLVVVLVIGIVALLGASMHPTGPSTKTSNLGLKIREIGTEGVHVKRPFSMLRWRICTHIVIVLDADILRVCAGQVLILSLFLTGAALGAKVWVVVILRVCAGQVLILSLFLTGAVLGAQVWVEALWQPKIEFVRSNGLICWPHHVNE